MSTEVGATGAPSSVLRVHITAAAEDRAAAGEQYQQVSDDHHDQQPQRTSVDSMTSSLTMTAGPSAVSVCNTTSTTTTHDAQQDDGASTSLAPCTNTPADRHATVATHELHTEPHRR